MIKKISIIIILFLISVNVVFAQVENSATSSSQNESEAEALEKMELIKKIQAQDEEIKAEYAKREALAREMIEKGEVQYIDSSVEENIPVEAVSSVKSANNQNDMELFNTLLFKIILIVKILLGVLLLEFVMLLFLYYMVFKKEKV